VQDLEQWIQNQQEYQSEHLVAWLFGAFAVLALALAATGLYSVVSFSVEQRTNEFGIRMALGAQRQDVFRIVFSSIFASVGGGLVAGIILSFALSSALAHWAEGSSRDLVVLISAVIVLSAVAALACAAPARRASGTDPMTALRYE
jgi:ABC-type antimicrobial peptide transport system permease subunit